jgi:hypothetical protein
MKYVLAALCGILFLFMGGCAVVSVMAMPFPLIPGAIAALNLAIIGALFGWGFKWRPAFYILGAIDLVIAVVAIVTASSMNASDQQLFWIAAVLFALKGVLSFVYAYRTSGSIVE